MSLGLTRNTIRQALAQLESCRSKQVILSSILRATRFKYYEGGKLLKTSCARCGREDNFRHLLECARLFAPVPSVSTEEMITFLVELATKAHEINKGIPIPRREDAMEMGSAPSL